MSIAAELARHAVLEALCPTACIASGTGFPTMAAACVYDSRSVSVADLGGQGPTPTLSVYTRSAASRCRGEAAANASRFASTIIEIAAELSVVDPDGDGSTTSALLAGSDPQAQMLLAALCSQVRYALTIGPTGHLFRKAVISLNNVEEERLAMPELGLRWHLAMISLECSIPDDTWGQGGGLPQPAAQTLEAFPADAPARVAMAALAAQFPALPVNPTIQAIGFQVEQRGASGQAGTTAAVHPPFAPIPE